MVLPIAMTVTPLPHDRFTPAAVQRKTFVVRACREAFQDWDEQVFEKRTPTMHVATQRQPGEIICLKPGKQTAPIHGKADNRKNDPVSRSGDA